MYTLLLLPSGLWWLRWLLPACFYYWIALGLLLLVLLVSMLALRAMQCMLLRFMQDQNVVWCGVVSQCQLGTDT